MPRKKKDRHLILYCPMDKTELELKDNSQLTLETNRKASGVYICPTCEKKYVHFQSIPDGEIIKFFNTEYTNIAPAPMPDKKPAEIDNQRKTTEGIPTITKENVGINLVDSYKSVTLLHPVSEINVRFQHPYCNKCGNVLKKTKLRISTRNGYVVFLAHKCRYCERLYVPNHIYSEYGGDVPKSFVVIKETNDNSSGKQETLDKQPADTARRNYNISAQDFVVRLNVLKCRNKYHHLQDIQASITTISRSGTVSITKVPAGYCPDCNMFFIMDNVYRRIRNTGIPICRVMDEKTYIEDQLGSIGDELIGRSSYDKLAQESVLHQFGYSVNQVDDLTAVQRHKILAAAVDYNVLTKTEIVSYLEYFINNRKNQRNKDGSFRYQVAVNRWREDLEWISDYKTGSFKEIAIKKIVTNK